MSKVAVLGYGTVGSGVVHVLSENADIISKKAGESIEVARVLDLRDFPGDPIQEKVTHDFADIENDADIDIVVETMGGTKPAYDFVKRSILAGKSVCTSNKALVADHGTELIRIAREKGVHFFFEASVGGGIPILRPLNRCIVADEILSIRGILNGTTNFILTKMADEGSDYADVLKEAQALGYAEADPSADVEGYDTCRKIAILTALAYGAQVNYEDIHTEGITDISATDIAYAKKLGYMIRLLGMSTRSDGKLYALVAPFMIPHSDPLYSVGGVFNAITLTGNMLGEVMFYGQGAGKNATASAVVTDIVEAVKNRDTAVTIRWDEEKQTISSTGSMVSRFFVRLDAGSRDAVGTVFPGAELTDGVKDDEIGFVTGEMSEKDFESALGKLNGVVKSIRCM
ncbi:MAG TPA: homoserine dehydrogenase [Lachnospiraceae bacterium]|nr:homoserine dehydrogenase [Lachnospiraceae bacterium]